MPCDMIWYDLCLSMIFFCILYFYIYSIFLYSGSYIYKHSFTSQNHNDFMTTQAKAREHIFMLEFHISHFTDINFFLFVSLYISCFIFQGLAAAPTQRIWTRSISWFKRSLHIWKVILFSLPFSSFSSHHPNDYQSETCLRKLFEA